MKKHLLWMGIFTCTNLSLLYATGSEAGEEALFKALNSPALWNIVDMRLPSADGTTSAQASSNCTPPPPLNSTVQPCEVLPAFTGSFPPSSHHSHVVSEHHNNRQPLPVGSQPPYEFPRNMQPSRGILPGFTQASCALKSFMVPPEYPQPSGNIIPSQWLPAGVQYISYKQLLREMGRSSCHVSHEMGPQPIPAAALFVEQTPMVAPHKLIRDVINYVVHEEVVLKLEKFFFNQKGAGKIYIKSLNDCKRVLTCSNRLFFDFYGFFLVAPEETDRFSQYYRGMRETCYRSDIFRVSPLNEAWRSSVEFLPNGPLVIEILRNPSMLFPPRVAALQQQQPAQEDSTS